MIMFQHFCHELKLFWKCSLWGISDKRLYGEKDRRLYFYDSDLDELRIKLFLENIGYIQENYEFSEFEKDVFPTNALL